MKSKAFAGDHGVLWESGDTLGDPTEIGVEGLVFRGRMVGAMA